jgi:hypothetical protein
VEKQPRPTCGVNEDSSPKGRMASTQPAGKGKKTTTGFEAAGASDNDSSIAQESSESWELSAL